MHDVQILDAFLSDLKTSRESRIVMDPESSNILILKDEDLNPVQGICVVLESRMIVYV